ncbi:MAG: hypothetical protein NVS3B7_06700 [Candidatus Elarobacter sp.]
MVVTAPARDDVLAASVTAVRVPDGASAECAPRSMPIGAATFSDCIGGTPRVEVTA